MSQQFITDIVVISSKDKCPPDYTIINTTVNGNDADLYEGSLVKRGERYLCFAKIPGASTMSIVTDVNIVKEKDPVPTGFTAIKTCKNDAGEKTFRKHILCLKTDSIQNAQTGLVEILVVQPSKGEITPGNYYTITNDVNGLYLCYCTMPMQVQQPSGQPPYGQHQTTMSYKHPNVQSSYLSPGVPCSPSSQHSGCHTTPLPSAQQATTQPGNKLSSAIQGVQFHVSPKFEMLWKKVDPLGKSTKTLSLDDIEKKYGYTFETERNLLASR